MAPAPGARGAGRSLTPAGATGPTAASEALVAEGGVAGTVTEDGTSTPLESVIVDVDDSAGDWIGWDQTDASGAYSVSLSAASYFIRTYQAVTHFDELYDYLPCEGAEGCDPTTGTGVPVVAGADTQGVDFALLGQGDLWGTVDDVVEAATCTSLRVGGALTIAPGAEVVLRSNGVVEVWDGVAIGPDAEVEIYEEDFGDGFALGWETSNEVGDLWRIDFGCTTPPSEEEARALARAAPDCDYDLGAQARGWARSPRIDLSDVSPSLLTLVHSWSTAPPGGVFEDALALQVSSDDGMSWHDVWTRTGSTSFAYVEQAFDVLAYTTSGFRIRLLFDSVNGSDNDHAGWYVDEIAVTEEAPVDD